MKDIAIGLSSIAAFIFVIIYSVNKFNKKENEKIDAEYEKEKLQNRIDSGGLSLDDIVKRVSSRFRRGNDKDD